MTMPDTDSFTTRKAYIEAWGTYFKEKMDAGGEGYLITLMFKQISGSEAAKLRVMEQELYRVYATHLSRLFRRPNAPTNRGKLPIWIASPDYPVAKHEKVLLDEVRINDGLHLHVAALYHRDRRFAGSIEDHFADLMHIYIHGHHELLRMHISPIETEERYVVGYGFKTVVKRASIGVDGLIVLPRTSGEVQSSSRAAVRPSLWV
ncbi:hypothetical protein [Methylobacterium sp. SI9]|uniref:hypothetical protein n=1 Tax=Methylobacterium guangdongense TaxID=3138811 RepID=UPI00313C38B1